MKSISSILKKDYQNYEDIELDQEQVIEFVLFPDYCGMRPIEPTTVRDLKCTRCEGQRFGKRIDHKFPKKVGAACINCTKKGLYWGAKGKNKVCPTCLQKDHYRSLNKPDELIAKFDAYLICNRCNTKSLDNEPWHLTEVLVNDDWYKYNQKFIAHYAPTSPYYKGDE